MTFGNTKLKLFLSPFQARLHGRSQIHTTVNSVQDIKVKSQLVVNTQDLAHCPDAL